MTAIKALPKVALVACFALGATQVTYAAKIELENDVNIDWSLADANCGTPIAASTCPTGSSVTILGAPRIVPNASAAGGSVFFEVTDISEDLNSFAIGLDVLFADGTPVPLQLEPKSAVRDQLTGLLLGFSFTLGDFANFNQLPSGVPLIFAVIASLDGQGVPQDPLAVITVSGDGNQISEVDAVPEPATLLLLGFGIAAMVRRYSARRESS